MIPNRGRQRRDTSESNASALDTKALFNNRVRRHFRREAGGQVIHIRWLGLKVGAAMSTLDSGIGLAKIHVSVF